MRGIPHTGLEAFIQKFNPKSVFLIGSEGFSIEKFFKTPLDDLI